MTSRLWAAAGVATVILSVASCGADDVTVVGLNEIPPVESLDEAELQDLQTIADQEGLTLAEAVAQYGWGDDFSTVVQEIRTAFPGSVADAAIVDGATAWVLFVGPAPTEARAMIDDALADFPYVAVTIEVDGGLSSEAANEILVAAYRAVFERSDVTDALGSFDLESRTVTITVAAPEAGGSQASTDDLRAVAEDGIRESLGPDAVGVMRIDIRQSPLTKLSSDD